MGLGNFGQKLVASAKLSSMEKYGWAYMEDYLLVKENLRGEVYMEELGDGVIRVTYNGRSFNVTIRDWTGPESGKKESEETQESRPKKAIEGERKGWVSIWDVARH